MFEYSVLLVWEQSPQRYRAGYRWTQKEQPMQKVNQDFLRGTGQRYKRHRDKIFDDTIIPFSPFLYLHLPHTLTHCFSNYIHKRLFHQIRSHSPFCYQDELLMCLSAEDKCAKSDSTLPVSKKNALSQTDVLISDVFSSGSVLTKKRNSKPSFAWHVSKHNRETEKMLTRLLLWDLLSYLNQK